MERKRNAAATAPAIDALLEGLNPAQRCAATYGIVAAGGPAGPLLIAAGAGTGKTKTLAHRVARLILGGADPRRLLLLTFTRRAALEMTRRAQQILVSSRPGRPVRGAETVLLPWSGTFHSIGSRLLRRHAAALSLDPSFTVLDRADSADLMDLVRSDLGLARTRSRFPKKGTCLSIYSYTVNAGRPIEDTLTDSYPWCNEWEVELKRLFAAYVAAKQRSNVLDYDDLLLYWREATQVSGVAAQMRADFDHILVDEYQDTNRLQAAILLALAPEGAGTASLVQRSGWTRSRPSGKTGRSERIGNNMAASSRFMITEAERRFPARIRIGIPPGGLGRQLDDMTAWLDANCGAGNWAMTPAGLRGVVNDALAIYFIDTALANAFVARWCLGYRVETYEGSFRLRNDEPTARIAAPHHRTP